MYIPCRRFRLSSMPQLLLPLAVAAIFTSPQEPTTFLNSVTTAFLSTTVSLSTHFTFSFPKSFMVTKRPTVPSHLSVCHAKKKKKKRTYSYKVLSTNPLLLICLVFVRIVLF